METIVSGLIKIIKGAKDSIEREQKIRQYFESVICVCISTALERIDDDLAKEYAKDGWRVERRDARTVQASYGAVNIRRRRMEKDGDSGIYPLDKELGIRKYQRYTPYLEYITQTSQEQTPGDVSKNQYPVQIKRQAGQLVVE